MKETGPVQPVPDASDSQEIIDAEVVQAGAEMLVLGAAIVGDDTGQRRGGKRFALGVVTGLLGLQLLVSSGCGMQPSAEAVSPQAVITEIEIISTSEISDVQPGGQSLETSGNDIEPVTESPVVVAPTAEPTVAPTEVPTLEPTAIPTETPLPTPTPEPTAEVIDAAAELAQGLETFAASPVSGQLEMVYSVHPEIRINPDPAKNLYNYFIEVVTTSKGFAPYWQALGLYDHASIMNYLEQNNYRVPIQVGEQFWPTVRFSNDSYIINGQESDWVRGDKRLETIDLSSLGFMLTDNEKMGNSAYADEVKKLYGQGNIGYLASGFSAALRYNNDGLPFIIVKESEEMSGTPDLASLSGKIVDEEYNKLLSMHVATLVRAISTSNPLRPEANNCTVPLAINPMRRGNCVPDDENGVHNMGIEYLGANIHTLNRLGLTGLFTIQP